MKKKIIFLLLLVLFANNIFAFTSGVQNKESQQLQKEKNISEGTKKTESSAKQETKKIATQKSRTLQEQKAKDILLSVSKNTGMHLQLSATQIFFPVISELERERQQKSIWGRCRIVTNPQPLMGLGISIWQTKAGYINQTLKEYIEQQAGISASILKVLGKNTERKIKRYITCIDSYAIIAARAIKILEDVINNFSMFSYKEIKHITKLALLEAEKETKEERSIAMETLKYVSCVFAGEIQKVQCGNYLLVISIPPVLYKNSIIVYNDSTIGGINANFSIVKNFSFQEAEKYAKTISNMKQVLEAIDKQITKTKNISTELAIIKTKRKALQYAIENDFNLTTNFLNSIQ